MHLHSRIDRGERCIGLVLDAEDRHDTVTDESVDEAAVTLDDVADLNEVPVEQVHQIIGRQSFRHGRGIGNVAEEDRDVFRFARSGCRSTVELAANHEIGLVEHQSAHAKLPFRPQLASEAHFATDFATEAETLREQGLG
jgi:hypothetical protein